MSDDIINEVQKHNKTSKNEILSNNIVNFKSALEVDPIDFEIDTLDSLAAADYKAPPNVIDPWLPAQGTCLLHAKAGTGKTMFSMTAAYALATGHDFLLWKIDRPYRVLYLDAEMRPDQSLNTYLKVATMFPQDNNPSPNLTILNCFKNKTELNLSDESHRQWVLNYVETNKIEVVIIDNISLLCPDFKENEAMSWMPMQTFETRLHKLGASVIRLMHTGKTGLVRASSKVFDAVHTTIYLHKENEDEQKAKFILKFEKARGFYGEQSASLDMELVQHGDVYKWDYTTKAISNYLKVIDLAKSGNCQADIADHLSISKPMVKKHIDKAIMAGELTRHEVDKISKQGKRY